MSRKEEIRSLFAVVIVVTLVISVGLAAQPFNEQEREKAEAWKQAYLDAGCYIEDDLPVTKFKDWYEKEGWICPK